MCGIVGYIGEQDAVPILINGLKKLEYRGYDSSGIAVLNYGVFAVRKYKGRLSVLEENLKSEPLSGLLGIGHTRWATHGEPSTGTPTPSRGKNYGRIRSHSGRSQRNYENYMELKNELIDEGYEFTSETDTEVLAHLIDYFYSGDLIDAVKRVLRRIRGSYAFVALSSGEPDRMVCVRKENPLIVGVGRNGNFAASDIPAILEHTRSIYLLDENELAVIKKDMVAFFDADGMPVSKTLQTSLGRRALKRARMNTSCSRKSTSSRRPSGTQCWDA